MTITKLLYKKIICVTKKDIVKKYTLIRTSAYTNNNLKLSLMQYETLETSFYFYKINDNETPRSYHDPKVPAHDV